MLLGTLDHHQALEFKKRWITYDLDRENPHAHLPVIEFFLNHGIKLLTPPKGKFNLHDRLESIDGEEAAKAVSKADISGSWVVNQSIFDSEPTIVVPPHEHIQLTKTLTIQISQRTISNILT